MDDRKLHVFLTTLRAGSFNKAAQTLNCTQSAVTQMMNSLESELGCKVLRRSHSGVTLTPAGEELYPLLLEADTALNRLMEESRKVSEGRSSLIRVGSFSSISTSWLPKLLLAYRKEHPEVTFDIRIGTDKLPYWLQNDVIDLALGDSVRCDRFQWYPLMDDPYFAVLPANYLGDEQIVISQEEFAGFPLIMDQQNVLDQHLSVLSPQRLNVRCDDSSTVLSIVSQGLGVSAIPKLCLGTLPDNVKILPLDPLPKRVLGVALPKSPSRTAAAFARYLRQQYPYPAS